MLKEDFLALQIGKIQLARAESPAEQAKAHARNAVLIVNMRKNRDTPVSHWTIDEDKGIFTEN
jgi:hypothetical protein|tara:strand:- start:417 stop:605 length:189 start_codon:yes stop_codon:yes gene_type:complete